MPPGPDTVAAVPEPDDPAGAVDLADAAARLGVHYQTAYRWVREGRLPAVRIRGRYRLAGADVDAFARARDEPHQVGPPPGRRPWERSAGRFVEALRAGDERAAAEVVHRLRAQQEALLDVLGRVVVPALRRIGEDWAAGTVSVAEEHRASEIVERILATLDHRRPGRPRGTVVVASPAGEHHSLPIALAAAALREDGWTVEHLGRDLPLEALAGFASQRGPDLVVLTVTAPGTDVAAAAAQERLAATGHAVLVGGPGRTLDELLRLARAVRESQRHAHRRARPAGAG